MDRTEILRRLRPLEIADLNVIGNVIAWIVKNFLGEFSGQRLHGPCSPGLACSVLLVPSSRTRNGSSHGAPP
jgi:hypothetical protein